MLHDEVAEVQRLWRSGIGGLHGGSAVPVGPMVPATRAGALTLLGDAILLDKPLHDVVSWGPRQH